MYKIFYKRFGYKPTKRGYYIFRIDWIKYYPRILYYRNENITWDVNMLLNKLNNLWNLQKKSD
jgi:hypothetical protein